jgi:aminoglycoside 3-N-acetyltransferase
MSRMPSDQALVEAANGRPPVTSRSLAAELGELGLHDGMTVLVHSSLSALGWVAGGAHAVILALCDAVGPTGTIMMPTHSAQLSDPVEWRAPPVPVSWWPVIHAEMPAFDTDLTPTRNMGVVPETFRKHPAALRSSQQVVFFVANFNRPDMELLGEMLADGRIKPVIDRSYSLDQAADAFRYLGAGHASGKVVITHLQGQGDNNDH